MAREQHRLRQPHGHQAPWIALLGVIGVLLAVFAAVWAGAQVNESLVSVRNPILVVVDVVTGRVPMTIGQGLLTFGIIAVLVAVAALLGVAALRREAGETRVDYKARVMATLRDVDELTTESARAKALELDALAAGVGSPLGTHLPSRRPLYANWEWVQIWLMGPRAGKTSCVCVPQILETKGPVVATSNKVDLADMTRGPRSEVGVCWVQDPQQIVREEASWWWNPLSFVRDKETAEKLADIFITSATEAGARQDAYFGSAGRSVLVQLLLAAALDGRPITDVYTWVYDPEGVRTDNPAKILAQHDQRDMAIALEGAQRLTPKQRDGVYGTAQPWVSVLGSDKVRQWITDPDGTRPHFDPEKFAISTDTLYLISKEGGGTARAITGALTMAVLEAAEQVASSHANGRLPLPMSVVLDEVANVCRWRDLPDVYSHYGSRGIILSAFFQSWAQGVEAFGEHGMDKLWGAANIRGVGKGLSDNKLLPMLSNLIGPHDKVKRTVSWQHAGRSVSTAIDRGEMIFNVADLGALPSKRAIVLSSGVPALLMRLDHFSERPYAEKVKASNRYYGGLRAKGGNEAEEKTRSAV